MTLPMNDTSQHPLDEGCFFCATDDELLRGVELNDEGKPWDGRTLHMQMPPTFCPHMNAADTEIDEAKP